MKKTMIGAVGAGVVALALAGAGTFAAWSDFSESPAEAGAGILQLDVTMNDGSTTAFDFGNLAPGENKTTELFIASSDAESVPNATLSMDLKNLVDIEGDGPGGTGVGNNCTTLSEADAESPTPDDLPNDGAVDCGPTGEFSEEAWIQYRYKAASSALTCGGGGYTIKPAKPLNTMVGDSAVTLDADLAPGEGVCVSFELGLPNGQGGGTPPPGIDFGGSSNATDASQGDSSTFDVRFDLVQNV